MDKIIHTHLLKEEWFLSIYLEFKDADLLNIMESIWLHI